MNANQTQRPKKEEPKMLEQRLEHIPLSACVATNYQRKTNDAQVAAITRKFCEGKLGALTVSLRDGNYHIVDGLHRSKALKLLGYTHALCIVLTGLTYEQEAELFRAQNENKRRVVTFDDFRAGLEARNEQCLKINEIVQANEFQIGKGGFYKLASVRALYTIAEDFGYGVLDDTLFLIACTWNHINKASQCEPLLGVAEFVSRYGIAEFSERMKSKFAVVMYDYTEAMRMKGSIASATSRKKFCRILVEHYNKGLTGNSKKRLKWEE